MSSLGQITSNLILASIMIALLIMEPLIFLGFLVSLTLLYIGVRLIKKY